MDVLDPLFPHLVRTARMLLGWQQSELAACSGVSVAFIGRLERGERLGQARKLRQLRDALTDNGVIFEANECRVGVWVEGQHVQRLRTEFSEDARR